jgi:hypothetical protein
MHTLYDHLGKTIGLSALGPCGVTELEAVIAPDPRRADLRHNPDPARDAERRRLGLLGRIASVLCLIELYSGAPDEDDAIACLGKLIAFRQEQQREAAKKRDALRKRMERENPGQGPPLLEPLVSPMCWLLAARHPAAVLSRFAATAAQDWPRGVYFGTGPLVGAEGILPMGIVDASELPRARSTLLVRFMAAGPLLANAIADLAALEEDAYERTVVEQILISMEHALGAKPSPTPEEEEFIVSMQGTWADARRIGREEGRKEGLQAGLQEGLQEGRAEEAARAVLTALRVRGIPVPDAVRERIQAEKDPARLERWHERAIVAASITEVLDEPPVAAGK